MGMADLYPHQQDAVYRVIKEFEAGRNSTLLVLATGTGKTRCSAHVAEYVIEEYDGRVLFLAHTGELITQAENEFTGHGYDPGVEQASRYARGTLNGDPKVVVGSVQTMTRERLESWPRDYFKLIISDEAHHSPSPMFQEIYSYFTGYWHLGLSATPDRLDGVDLGTVFESIAFQYGIRQAVKDQKLKPIKVHRCRTSVNLGSISTTRKKDLNRKEVERAILPHCEELSNQIVNEIGARRTIVFTPDIGSAQAIASALRSLGTEADWVAGNRKDRDDVLASFRLNRFQVLVNAQLLTEGYDAPFVSCVVLARPTQSRARYIQMVGRGTRLFPGDRDCLVVDFAWLTAQHRLVQPAVLMERPGEPIPYLARRRIEKALDAGLEVDLLAAVEEGERAARELPEITLEVKKRDVRYKRYTFDPVQVLADALVEPASYDGDATLVERATPKQANFLANQGVKNARNLSRRRANQLVAAARARFKMTTETGEKLSTLGQVNFLIKLGCDPREASAMGRTAASAEIDRRLHARGRVG